MKKLTGTIIITMLLMMPLLLVIPTPVIAEPTEDLSSAIGGGTGGEYWLDPTVLYTTDSDVTITGDTYIYGRGARIDLDGNDIDIVGAYLYIERCLISNGDDGLDFEDGASGYVYNNVIADCDYNGIEIEEGCSDITIKENSIIHNDYNGIDFEEATDITILENTIKNNDEYGIYGDNWDLVDSDGDGTEDDYLSLHNIVIKGNNIGVNEYDNIYLEYVNGIYIASNLIYSSPDDYYGIYLYYCPIVSITHNKILSNVEGGIYYSGDSDWPDLYEDDPDNAIDVDLSLTISYNKMGGNGYDEPHIYAEYTQNVVITYNEIFSSYYEGIELYGDFDEDHLMEPVFIAYNRFAGLDEEGISMDYISDVSILFNLLDGGGGYGIGINDNPPSPDPEDYGEGLLIKGNVLRDLYDYAMTIEYFDAPVIIEYNTVIGSGYGLYLDEVESPQILHNSIMYIYEDDEALELVDCDGARIAYNTIAYNTDDNIYVNDSDDVIVEHNTIIGGAEDGIDIDTCEDVTVQYNTIHNNGDDGISWYDSSGLISDNIIGHTDGGTPSTSISGNEYGIYLSDSHSGTEGLTTISDNIIVGNDLGIDCSDSDPTIIGNYIAYNVWGIHLSGDSDATIGGTYDNRNYIVRNFEDGIDISSDTSDPTITYNNIYENFIYGVEAVTQTDGDIDAENNFWGDISGPGDPATFGEGPGIGDEVSDDIDYTPWEVSVIP